MIKFFRKIRQQLLLQNRFRKYILYAIGEIVLVMIGILLALQVNNWNQSRQDKKFETTMLHEIKGSLESDLFSERVLKNFINTKQKGIQELLKMTTSNQIYPDSMLLKVYNDMTFHLSISYNKGGYEAIKSVGIDKISNDSLRKMLIETYEVLLPRAERLIESRIEDDLGSQEYKLRLHNALWKRIRIQMPDNSYKLVSQPIDSENFLKKDELLDRIKIEQDIVNVYNFWMQHFRRSVENCLEAVNKELEND